jgi:hypothetical protein
MNRSFPQEQDKARKQQKPQADTSTAHLRQRDLDILRLIGEQAAYRFDQLQTLLARHCDTRAKDPTFLSPSQTYTLIRRWKKLGLVTTRTIIYHYEPGWISLTQRGLALVGVSAQSPIPHYAELNQLFWVNETRALVEERYESRSGFQWESQREYQRMHEYFKNQQEYELEMLIPLEYQSPHSPDAVVRYRLEEDPEAPEIVSAIEIELSEKTSMAWKKSFVDLARFFDCAHYYVDPALRSSLEKALEQFQNEKLAFGDPEREQRLYIHVHDLEQQL